MSTAFTWLAGAALAVALAGPAAAQDWTPTRPIEILVGFAPGGSADQIARQLSEAVKNTVPVPVVVINKPGVAGVLAAQEIAAAEPDGYKLFVGGGSETTSVGNHQKISYDPRRDFTPVLKAARLPSVLAVNVNSPYPDMKALIAAAQGKPEALSYGSTGNGSLFHSTMLAFEANSGLRFLHVPYKGAAASLTALAAGEIDMAFGAPEEVRGLIDAGKIKPVALFSKSRLPSLPDTPTMTELGYPIALDNMKGLLAPANLPEPVYRYLNRVFHDALQSPSWKAYAERSGLTTDYADGPTFQKEIDDSYTLIGKSLEATRSAAK